MLDSWAYASPARLTHPAERLLLALGLLAEALVLPPLPAGPIILGLACLAAVAVARVPARAFLAGLAVPAGFILSGGVVLAVSLNTGEGGLGLSISREGALAAGLVSVRALAGAACLLLLACTTPPPDLARCCARCRVPAELTDLALLMYRFLFLLAETSQAIGRSQAARLGYGDVRRSVRSTAVLLSSLFVRSLDRAGRLEAGLAGRGYTGSARMLRVGRPLAPGPVAAVLAVLAVPAISALWTAAP